MDLERALTKGVSIEYSPVKEIRLPEDTRGRNWLRSGLLLTGGISFKNCDKFGLFDARAGEILPAVYKAVSLTPSGCIGYSDKNGTYLAAPDGRALAGPECEESRDLGDGVFAKRVKKRWALFRISDCAQLTDFIYEGITDFSEGTAAAKVKGGAVLIGSDGRQLFDAVYDDAAPFKEGVARVLQNKRWNYIDLNGGVVYSGAGKLSRDFCNGYAVIADDKGRLGAIDKSGKVVVPPEYVFLKDCGYDQFICSKNGQYVADGKFSGKDFGVVDVNNTVLLHRDYQRVEQHGGMLRFGHIAQWSVPNGSNRIVYGVFVFGVADAKGKTVLPEKYVSVGETHDGLAAFKSLEGNTLTFGYLDAATGREAIRVASIDYSEVSDLHRDLLRAPMPTQLGDFNNGKARIRISSMDTRVGLFGRKTVKAAALGSWYTIDTSGCRIESEQVRHTPEHVLRSASMAPYAGKMLNLDQKQLEVQYGCIREFSAGYEAVVGTKSFVLLDHDLNVLAAGGKPEVIPGEYLYGHKPYGLLLNPAENVWVVYDANGNGPNIVFSEFESPSVYSSGLAAALVPVEKGKPLFGYMDKNGRTVVPAAYSEATGFSDGFATAKKPDGSWYILVRDGLVADRPD